jgi:hypothetical protein
VRNIARFTLDVLLGELQKGWGGSCGDAAEGVGGFARGRVGDDAGTTTIPEATNRLNVDGAQFGLIRLLGLKLLQESRTVSGLAFWVVFGETAGLADEEGVFEHNSRLID